MATRLYTSTTNPAGGPAVTPDASWENTSQAGGRRDLVRAKTNQAIVASASVGGNGTNPNDVLIQQFISPPLVGAQTITGTFKGQLFARGATGNFRAQVVVRVVSNNGTTIRGTLVPSDTSASSSVWSTTAAINRKFPLAAISPVTVSSVSAQDGDRICVEVGARVHSTLTTATNNFVRFGNPTSSDLAEDETSTDNGLRAPWFEFSQDLIFEAHSGTGSLALTPSFSSTGGKAATNTAALALAPSFSATGRKGAAGTGALTSAASFARTGTKGGKGAGSLSAAASFAETATKAGRGTGALATSASFADTATKATSGAGVPLGLVASFASAGYSTRPGAGSLGLMVGFGSGGTKDGTGAGAMALALGLSASGTPGETHTGAGTMALVLGFQARGRGRHHQGAFVGRIAAPPVRRKGAGALHARLKFAATGGKTGASGTGELAISPAFSMTASRHTSGEADPLFATPTLTASGVGEGATVRSLYQRIVELEHERDDLEAIISS